jgi:hypothetical protein
LSVLRVGGSVRVVHDSMRLILSFGNMHSDSITRMDFIYMAPFLIFCAILYINRDQTTRDVLHCARH